MVGYDFFGCKKNRSTVKTTIYARNGFGIRSKSNLSICIAEKKQKSMTNLWISAPHLEYTQRIFPIFKITKQNPAKQ